MFPRPTLNYENPVPLRAFDGPEQQTLKVAQFPTFRQIFLSPLRIFHLPRHDNLNLQPKRLCPNSSMY